ncbi:MAG: ABC transporter ATP-binding protein [Bacteriovoracaceae bacterium]|nr:ABC transporter ATP-binding protein [Bacteriovoracaceae bacterium]
MKRYMLWFSQYWKKTKWRMVLAMIITVLTIAAKTGFPLFLKFIIDELSGDFKSDHVYHLILLFVVFSVVNEVLRGGLPFLRGYLNLVYASMIRTDYYKWLTTKTSLFFNKFKTGDLITRLTDDIDGHWMRIMWYSCSGILRPLEAILILCFTLGVMFWYSVPLTLCTFLPLPVLLYVLHLLDGKIITYTIDKQKSISHCNNILETSFSGIRVIKTTLSEKHQHDLYSKATVDRVAKEKKFLLVNQLVHLSAMLVNHAGSIIVIFIGGYLAVKGRMTIGTLVMFILYLQNLIEPIWTLSLFYASSKQIFKYVDRLMEIETVGHDLDPNPLGVKIKQIESLVLEDISWRYEDKGHDVFKNINLTINKGEKIAIMGGVGSGKSSLLELISANLTLEKGKIIVNGHLVSELERKSFVRQVGYVRQENILFSETIRQNILLGDDFTGPEIDKVLTHAMIKDEVDSFRDGIETIVGQKGASLSGGQKQRLALARTLIRNPSLLLLDDCTAAMDAETEEKFWDFFGQSYHDTTCIVVTHRLSTAARADRILFLDDKGMAFIKPNDLTKHWSTINPAT